MLAPATRAAVGTVKLPAAKPARVGEADWSAVGIDRDIGRAGGHVPDTDTGLAGS